MNLRILVVLACLFHVACATSQMATTASSGNSTETVADGPPDHSIVVDADEGFRARQANLREQYHAAFDQNHVVLVDLAEGSTTPDFWRVRFRFTPPNNQGTQLNVECGLNGMSRPVCAVPMPPSYEGLDLSIERTGSRLPARFWGRLRVRRANQRPVEYRPIGYDENTGTTELVPVTP